MRRPYQIEFIATDLRTDFVLRSDAFKFKPTGRFAWMQNLAWRFLNWSMAIQDYHEPVVTSIRHTIDADKFMDRLYKQREYVFRQFGKSPTRLLIGSEDYAEIMSSPEIIPYHFEFVGDYARNQQLVGLKIEVIPWMRGILVMP